MEENEIAWLAGLLEGEGTFYVRTRTNRRPAPVVAVKMTDNDVIERVATLFGVSVVLQKRGEPHHQDQYKASVQGKRAVYIMQAILPYMGERRAAKIQDLLDRVSAGELVASGTGRR